MEQEQSDFLSGRKVNGTLAACLGAVFGIGLTAIIAYVYFDAPKSMEIHLALFVFVAVGNILATCIWLFGSIKSKNQFMLGSLIFWGTLLNIWLGFLIKLSIKQIPYGPGAYYKADTFEVVAEISVVFSTLLFMSMVLVYKSLGKDIRKMYNCDWQTGGVLAGWIVIALGIGQTLLFYAQRAESDFYYYGTILYIVLNLTGAISWLYAVATKKSVPAALALFCWIVTLGVWIGVVIYGINKKGYEPGDRKHGQNLIYSISICHVVFYVCACYAFKLILSSNESDSERFNVAYASPPNANKKMDA